jgi:SAM-dependent methyltransferase
MSLANPEQDMERIIPEELSGGSDLERQILRLHLDRYSWAAHHASGRRVLDVACGVGYGAKLLGDAGADQVLAADVSPKAIEYATRVYQGSGIEFRCAGLLEVPRGEGFGLVVSLETLEHLESPESAILHLRSLLKPDGIIVSSVPVTYSTDFNPHHLHDFTGNSFLRLLVSCRLRPVAALLQVHRFSPSAVFRARSDEAGRMGSERGLARHYLTHPWNAVRRAATVLRHGFANKYLVVRAVPDDGYFTDNFDVRGLQREVREYG